MAWRYENPGYRELLTMPGHTVKCAAQQSKTGYAFWQNRQLPSFDIPESKELWVRFDIYIATQSYYTFRAFGSSNGNDGIYHPTNSIYWIVYARGSEVGSMPAPSVGLHSCLLHMVSDETDGKIQFWMDDKSNAVIDYTGSVKVGLFDFFFLESDNKYSLCSNVIISDEQLSFDDNCDLSKTQWIQPVIGKNGTWGVDDFAVRRSDGNTSIYKIFDVSGYNIPLYPYTDFYIKENVSIKRIYVNYSISGTRNTYTHTLYQSDDGINFEKISSVQKAESDYYALFDLTDNPATKHYYRIEVSGSAGADGVTIDANVQVAPPSKDVIVNTDTCRNVSNAITHSSDTARHIVESLNTQQDTARALTASAMSYADTSRVLSSTLNMSDDTLRTVSRDMVINADTVRMIAENIDVDMVADTARNLYRVESMLDDTTRKISNLESINADIKRTVTAYAIDTLDTMRTLTHTARLMADTVRDVVKSIDVDADTARITNSSTITLHADTSRQLANDTAVTVDTARGISLTLALSVDLSRDTGKISFDADVTRKLYKIVSVHVDTVRRIPHDLFGTKEPVFENHDTFTPFPQNVTKGAEKGIINFKLVLEENTLSDKISAEVIGFDYWPEDIIKGTFIDYPYEMKIESTQNTGARQTINAMHYKDRLLYTGMHYDGYHLYELNRNRNASYRYMLRAQWYVNRIKESLSLHVDSRFSNFTPESNFSDTDITYADLLSGLFGWTSQYPWRLVNVFLRGGTLYILQRGRENSVYDITNLPHTEPQIERSIYYSPYASNNKNNTYTSSRIKVPHDPMLDVKDPDKPDEPDDSEYKDPNDGDTDQSVEVRFSGTIMGDHISQTYSNGLCVKEVHTVDAYDEMGRKYEKIDVIVERDYDGDDRCTYEQTNNADGTWRKTDTSYTSDGGVGLGSHSHTEDGDEYGVVQTSDTYTAYLGSGFTCTSTYVDGQFVSSSISGSGISNRTIPYTQNQQNAALKQGAASSDDNDDDINASRASRSSDAKTDPYIPTVDHSIRKQIQSEIDAYDRSVQETVSLEIIMPVVAGKPTMTHIIDFTERIKFNGAEYYLVRNTVDQTVSSLKQSIEITRWIRR